MGGLDVIMISDFYKHPLLEIHGFLNQLPTLLILLHEMIIG